MSVHSLAVSTAKPEAVGLSSDQLRRMDQSLKRRYLDSGRFAGMQILVYRRGHIAHFTSQGFADLERRQPVGEDTIYRIYSMTKPITSVALMMLVEEGLIGIEDPVHKYIPSWKDLRVYVSGTWPDFVARPCERPMLVIDLLRHTSGLTYGFQQRTPVDAAYRALKIGEVEKSGTLQSMIDQLAGLPLEFSPGQAWNYSVSTDVVGWLVQLISGMTFEDFVQTRILDPLEMHDTGFFVPPSKAHRLAACYAADGKGGKTLLDDPATSTFLQPPDFISGGGGLVSTAKDYLTFARVLLNGGSLGDVRLIGRKTLDLMTANHLPGGRDLSQMSISLFSENTFSGVGFGLGFSVTTNPAATMLAGSAGEFAWGGAASTAFWVDPREELIVLAMAQFVPSTLYPVRRELRSMIYAAITG